MARTVMQARGRSRASGSARLSGQSRKARRNALRNPANTAGTARSSMEVPLCTAALKRLLIACRCRTGEGRFASFYPSPRR
ncbi:hypothetical protein Zm00014a_025758 [Zea mays]|uniref:Uncharacterized protein n=1 Tax=Zea mays TaxID=4577 RepID=A0A3L6FWC0_MAIZE|nr:hypothetical protein Zm00014a_025758 [Zea mays]